MKALMILTLIIGLAFAQEIPAQTFAGYSNSTINNAIIPTFKNVHYQTENTGDGILWFAYSFPTFRESGMEGNLSPSVIKSDQTLYFSLDYGLVKTCLGSYTVQQCYGWLINSTNTFTYNNRTVTPLRLKVVQRVISERQYTYALRGKMSKAVSNGAATATNYLRIALGDEN